MANLYTDLFGSVSKTETASGALTTSTSRIYYGPSITQEGSVCTRVATYTGTIALADVLHIAGNLVTGERLISMDWSMSTDPDVTSSNDSTPDIGTTTDPNGILALSTAFQAGADVNVETSGQAVPTLVAVKGDEYILTMTVGSFDTSAVHTITIVTTV